MYSEVDIKLVRDESENKSFIQIGGNVKNMPPDKKVEFCETVTRAVCMVFGIDPAQAQTVEPLVEMVDEAQLLLSSEVPEILQDPPAPAELPELPNELVEETPTEEFTVESALATTVAFGDFKKSGKTLKELIEKDKKAFEWLVKKCAPKSEELIRGKRAALYLVEKGVIKV